MKLDLENDNVFMLETSKDAIRSYFDGKDLEDCIPDIELRMDEAQGYVMSSNAESYLVIKITK